MNGEEYQKTRETLKNIVESADTAMLVTTTLDGHIVSRPMQLQKVEFNGDLWFLTLKDTEKYYEIKHNDVVNVVIAEKSYASITGHAEIVDDLELKKKFWNKAYEDMFNMDYTDPRVTLIKIHAESAEYWDTGSTVKSAFNFVRKVVGNEEPGKPSNSTNQTLEL
ncbi:general stress protein [Lysinibacillus yapensis]|uniref:General stress protein n=1 Tax=Ureibacillus yapensis TaxID=2304605 RepID=A0A396S630_9BACL|nr:pyridoxamine 5'-phosphate oxidase family protein [Lysinibacillus yapensis]RHW34752.1 general stress protein [Lysinibacillus yapensis]